MKNSSKKLLYDIEVLNKNLVGNETVHNLSQLQDILIRTQIIIEDLNLRLETETKEKELYKERLEEIFKEEKKKHKELMEKSYGLNLDI